MIKSFYIKTALTFCMVVLFAGYSLAEITKQQQVLLINDSKAGFPVLKNLFDAGFFTKSNFLMQYSPSDSGLDKKDFHDNFYLTSGLKNSGNNEDASFNLYISDPLKQNIILTWDIPRNDSSRQKQSIGNMLDFSYNVYNYGVPEAIINTTEFSNDLEKVEVNYSDSDKTKVTDYSLTVRTRFSPTHRFIRTLSELGLLTGVGMANYWINKDANMEDWRYKYTWEDVGRRFRDGWSFDTNAFRTNTIYHIYSGAIYYQIGRSNDYGILASTAWAFTGSLIWEYIGEWRERTSGNDMFITGICGAIAGEAFRQSSIYVEQCMPKSIYGTVFSFLLDPMRIINRSLDRAFDGHYNVRIMFMNPAVQSLIEKTNKK